MKDKLLVIILLLSINRDSFAQYVIGDYRYSCPAGVGWNDPRCIREAIGGSSSQSSHEQMRWATRWGAIYMDYANGNVGTAEDMHSQVKAQKKAFSECRANGGSKCVEAISYYDQCGVIAWGSSYAVTQGAGTIEQASKIALERCAKRTSDCAIFYAGCSYPERIR